MHPKFDNVKQIFTLVFSTNFPLNDGNVRNFQHSVNIAIEKPFTIIRVDLIVLK